VIIFVTDFGAMSSHCLQECNTITMMHAL